MIKINVRLKNTFQVARHSTASCVEYSLSLNLFPCVFEVAIYYLLKSQPRREIQFSNLDFIPGAGIIIPNLLECIISK